MSFHRYVYYCATAGGWGAFGAWALAQAFVLGHPSLVAAARTTLTAALVGGAVGLGLNLVSMATGGSWIRRLGRGAAGLATGAVAGALGGYVGEGLFVSFHVPRAVGWMVIGLGIGSAEGLIERSGRKLRNGLLGGGVGGLCGGLLFDKITMAGSDESLGAIALGLVVLGTAVGAMTGLAQVVLKEAWLTVLDGFRPGQQLILSRDVTVLGRADYLPLPLLGPAARDLEGEHALVQRTADGTYTVQDNGSRLGTLLNGQRLERPVPLADGDLLRLGGNVVRFNQRHRLADERRGPQAGGSGAVPFGPSAPPPATAPSPPAAFPPVPIPPPPRTASATPPPVAGKKPEPAGPPPSAPRIPTPPPPPPRRTSP